MRLSIISFAATARTLVAVGTVNEPSIDCTTLAATPRSGSTEDAPGVTKVGIGLTIGSAGLNVVLATTTGSTFSTITGAITTGGVTTAAAGAGLANCDFGIGGVPGLVAGVDEITAPFNDELPLKSAKKSHQALSTEDGSLW